MKQCSKCGEIKPRQDYYKRKEGWDGLRPDCKLCYKQLIRKWQKQTNYKSKPISGYHKKYFAKKRKTDIQFKLKENLRNRLNQAIKNNFKSGSAVRDLGCSIIELRQYLESKFQPGMTWDNYGQWHIDHIRPLASFNLLNTDELQKACHFSNLQPLWAEENIKKHAKYVLSEKII